MKIGINQIFQPFIYEDNCALLTVFDPNRSNKYLDDWDIKINPDYSKQKIIASRLLRYIHRIHSRDGVE